MRSDLREFFDNTWAGVALQMAAAFFTLHVILNILFFLIHGYPAWDAPAGWESFE